MFVFLFQAGCDGPSTSYNGVSYTTSQVLELLDLSQLVNSSSSESESEYDLSDPEAEVMFINSEALADSVDSMSSPSGAEGTMSALANVSSHDSSDSEPVNFSKSKRSRGRGIGSRGRGERGHGKGASKASGRRQRQTDDLDICDLTTVDNDVPSLHQFNPSRSVGVHLPLHSEDWSPEELFKLYFDSEIVNMICNASNEYAERNKNKYPVMYSYFRKMEPIDFYNLVGILVHLGYRKIPRARLMWSPTSLCYDPLISKVMSTNRFDSLLTFLHLVDEDTEKSLQKDGDKLLKVRSLND